MRAYKLGYGKAYTVGVAAVSVLGVSPSRIALNMSAHHGNIWVSDNPNMAVGQGVCVSKDFQPTEICSCHQGSWLGYQLFAIADTAGSTLYVIEGFDPVVGGDLG